MLLMMTIVLSDVNGMRSGAHDDRKSNLPVRTGRCVAGVADKKITFSAVFDISLAGLTWAIGRIENMEGGGWLETGGESLWGKPMIGF
jgi:hypothetical protein